jgi:hypothetical protein
MALPEWLREELQRREMNRFNADPANRRSYTLDEWMAKLEVEMPARGYVKTATGWTYKPCPDCGCDGQRASWPADDGPYDPKTDRFGWL